jgi:hypothetical protein
VTGITLVKSVCDDQCPQRDGTKVFSMIAGMGETAAVVL